MQFQENQQRKKVSYVNRGMIFEQSINNTINIIANNKALIHKKPTPIHIVKIDNSNNHARICDAYFEQPSTTDYNGYIRDTTLILKPKKQNKTCFPLRNINEHQVKHLLKAKEMGNLIYVIRFTSYEEVYLVDASIVGKLFL